MNCCKEVDPNPELPNLLSLLPEQFKEFMDSIDVIITDCDGVLWHPLPIPGVRETLNKLKSLGKKVYFVSNNGAKSFEDYEKQFKNLGFELNTEHLIHPTITLVKYLKSVNFIEKKIYAIATPVMIEALKNAGYDVVLGPSDYPHNLKVVLSDTKDDPEIEGVLVDMDLQLNYHKLLKAIAILKRPEVLYLVGATDKALPVADNLVLPGPGHFQDIVSTFSGRTPVVIGKPSEYLKTVVTDTFNITEPKRTLFIGDMIEQDMAFGSLCGFQKLLVLTGGSTLMDALDSPNPACIPDFYLDSLGDLGSVLEKMDNLIPGRSVMLNVATK